MASLATHRGWLRISAVVIGCFGPVLTLGTMPATDGLAQLGLDILAWPLDGFPSFHAPDIRFLSALTGGFLVGWGVTIWMLSVHAFDAAPEAVRKALLYGACSWFAFDSFGSITSGNAWNALWNVLVLLLVVGPMWRPAQA